jgi:hypothetical protein
VFDEDEGEEAMERASVWLLILLVLPLLLFLR